MMASTARIIIRAFLLVRPTETRPSLSARDGRFRGYRDLGELELRPAARAQGIVELDDLPAAGAPAPQLVAVVAVRDRRDQPEEGQDRGDHEPQEERRALDLADEPAGQAERQADDDVGHQMWRSAQSTAHTAPTITTIVTSSMTRPMSAPSTSLAAIRPITIRTTQASTRLPRPDPAEFSIRRSVPLPRAGLRCWGAAWRARPRALPACAWRGGSVVPRPACGESRTGRA